jgi:hypothetical protein
VAFYNLHHSIGKPEKKPLTISTTGFLKDTGNLETLRRRNLLKEKYGKDFLYSPLTKLENFSLEKTLIKQRKFLAFRVKITRSSKNQNQRNIPPFWLLPKHSQEACLVTDM